MQRLRQPQMRSQDCREIFLERMDGPIPWERLEARIVPAYPKGGSKGQQPHSLPVMEDQLARRRQGREQGWSIRSGS